MNGASTPGIIRGCGTRTAGGIYLEVNTSPYGSQPLIDFVLDPPLPMKADCAVGVSLQERKDTTMVIDHVGSSYYPNAADFLVEGFKHGFSRRVSPNLDFSRIKLGCRILFIHDRGLITHPEELRPYVPEAFQQPEQNGKRKPFHQHNCVKLERTGSLEHYETGSPACISDLWCLPEATRTVEEGDRVRFFRDFASVSYEVFPTSPDAPAVKTTSALLAALPITNISVVRSPDGSHKATASVLEQKLGGAISLTITDA